ncbi:MAG: GTPase ObgE [Bdellovibrionota bacterium]
MKFRDEAKVRVRAGNGGNGVVHWRREKYVPKGGPDGGNGGAGGAVIFVADENINTLIDFAYNPLLEADDGGNGDGGRCDGRHGDDRLVKVPVGTEVYFDEELVADLASPGARWIAARGGIGGKGNAFFKSSTNVAPTRAQPGRKGESFEFKLVLKSVADVGLVGLPNVGKSTLISVVSNARPLIADYPFTTITPNLGVVVVDEQRKFVIADIPGLIPEAHLGRGLGITFLKHIERTTVLAQIVDVTTSLDGTAQPFLATGEVTDDELRAIVEQQLSAIEHELGSFSHSLLELKREVIFTKADLPFAERALDASRALLEKRKLSTSLVCAKTGLGIEALKSRLFELVRATREKRTARPQSAPESDEIGD